MSVNAYILVADPAWIEQSILSYYAHVDRIFVSYDRGKVGWTGSAIPVEECLERIRALDTDRKTQLLTGHYARLGCHAMANETLQRQVAMEAAASGADWVLQLDTDEILPNAANFVRRLGIEIPADVGAVEWPMRTFFHETSEGRYLEVCTWTGKQVSSYPGPIALRPGVTPSHARQSKAKTWRYDIRPYGADPGAPGRSIDGVIDDTSALIHMSWVRSDAEIRAKLSSWGHSRDFDWVRYYERVWSRAPAKWRWMFNFHPFVSRWWPALRAVDLATHLSVLDRDVSSA